jgi:glucokinase
MADPSLLIGDIGGTNARFALADRNSPGFSDAMTLQCADYDSAEAAIRHYLDSVGATSPDVICLAAAGPVVGQRVRMTNNHWTLASDELTSEFSANAARLLNDFEAIAYGVPLLASSDCEAIGLPDPVPLSDEQYTVAIVGPGTGLGAVGLRRQGGLLVPVAAEASHGGFAPETRVQLDVLLALRERFDRVSTERLVSGPGIENIYGALASIHGVKLPRLSAAEIFAAADDNSDPHAVEAASLFFEVLGQFAGDFALALGATDGVFVAGGIVKRYPDLLANSRFRSGFESKGRYRALMERVPTQLVLHEQPGLLGASYYALQLLLS